MMEKIEISQIQEQFWILQNLYRNTTAYNIPSVVKIEGKLNMDALQNAIKQIVLRHEMLRTRFLEETDKVYQEVVIDSQIKIKVDVVNFYEPFPYNLLPEQILEEVNRPFDLTVCPLFRVKLFSFTNNISVLTIVFHHIIIDLYSLQVFARELSELYNSYSAGYSPVLNDPVNNYSDYSTLLKEWLSSEKGKKKTEEWKEDIPQKPEILGFSTDFTRPKINNLEGKRKHFILESVTSSKISEFAEKNSVNDFTVLLAAYATLLNRLSNQSKIIIGVPFANRKSAEFRETLGCFVNILPIPVDFTEKLTMEGLLMQIFQSLLKAHRKQEVPFLLLNSTLGQNDGTSLFQAGFTFEPLMQLHLKGTVVIPLVVERDGAQLELFLSLWEDGGKYNAYVQYSSHCFNKETIEHFWEIYCTAIHSLIDAPHHFINEVSITPEEDLQFIYELNRTEVGYEDNICIHQKFEQQVEKTPDNPALLFNNHSLSYRDLNDHANRMANTLIRAGVRVEDVVGICIDRSVEMMIGIYGILKAGAAYLPLSPDTPTERLKSIIIDANPKIILTSKSSSVNIPDDSPLLYIDDILKNPLSGNSSNPDVEVNSKNLAYIIYTSGSTGKPKGVMIEHHSVLNRLGWMQKAYPIGKSDTLLQKTPITFDVSVWELFWWAFNGARLVLLPKGGEKDPETIVQYINNYKVTTIHFVPSMFIAFFEMLKARQLFYKLKSLNRLFMSGEALPLKLVKEFNEMRAIYSLPDLINLYGPTEATVDVSYFNCPEVDIKNVFIGRPIDNTKLFVLNDKNIIQPIGVPGELIITGVNLARGYLNHPELTHQKFFDFKISEDNIVKAYRTGDLVKLTPEIEIDYIGRLDNQVKIRGFRIELGDIESKILEHPQVTNCAVIVAENIEPRSLIAYVCLKPGIEIGEEIIRKYLSGKLPDYMVPSYIIFLETLPLTSSGKLNRKSLPGPYRDRAKNIIAPPTNSTEKRLLDLWKSLLKIETISISDNFFDVGGNSLLAINLATLISEEFKIVMNTITVLEFPSIKGQSDFLAGRANLEFSSESIDPDEKNRRRKSIDFKKYRV